MFLFFAWFYSLFEDYLGVFPVLYFVIFSSLFGMVSLLLRYKLIIKKVWNSTLGKAGIAAVSLVIANLGMSQADLSIIQVSGHPSTTFPIGYNLIAFYFTMLLWVLTSYFALFLLYIFQVFVVLINIFFSSKFIYRLKIYRLLRFVQGEKRKRTSDVIILRGILQFICILILLAILFPMVFKYLRSDEFLNSNVRFIIEHTSFQKNGKICNGIEEHQLINLTSSNSAILFSQDIPFNKAKCNS